jgi:hypothetical protein|tara:strand:+ start:186 stop:407 length:222 start_codon:yes stop_codon:yes gene_type:complete
MATTPKKSPNSTGPKRSPVSPGFGKRVVNSMTSPFKKTIKNAFNAAFKSPTPTSKKSKRRNNVNKALTKKIKK